jgi:oligopeptide/dipeptide ABC transporter ATP-binding protein
VLDLVHIPAAAQRLSDYPHQLSGGMRQRVMLAMALVCSPKLLIADEPTTALDVTVQAEILDLLRELQRELGLSIVFVTHDFGVVADICDRVAVMYAGQVVEEATVEQAFRAPQHPYTAGLLAAMPPRGAPSPRLYAIAGTVPPLTAMPAGCRFHPRCSYATEECMATRVELEPVASDGVGARPGLVRCVRRAELALKGSA